MSKQLTLTGISFKPKPYFKKESTLYEKFVNKKWSTEYHRFGRKQDFLSYVLQEWENLKDSPEKVREYLARKEKDAFVQNKPFFERPPSQVDKELRNESCQAPQNADTCTEQQPSYCSHTKNPGDEAHNRDQYLKSHELVQIKKFLETIGIDPLQFLLEDILADEFFMKFLTSLMYPWNEFQALLVNYEANELYNRKSALKIKLHTIKNAEADLKKTIENVISLKCGPGLCSSILSETYLKRSNALKNVILAGSQLKNLICDKDLVQSLRRRIRQQEQNKGSLPYFATRYKNELMSCFCFNSTTLSWDEVFENLSENQNSCGSTHFVDKEKLCSVATLMSNNIILSSSELSIDNEGEKREIMQKMPVMMVSKEDNDLFINLHEFIFTPGLFEAFLCSDDKDALLEGGETRSDGEKNNESKNDRERNYSGQPSIVSKFPGIIDKAAEFMKQHGFAAHHSRRAETGYSSGVTIAQVRDHLFNEIAGLKEFGMSSSTVRRIFNAPNKGNTASVRYKGYVDARVGTKCNSYREHHPDAHYLFSRNKQRREFASLFRDSVTIISTDDMAKIKVGPPAVSRYHQIKRLFPTNDTPNNSDHDFPVPNYLLSASGYMLLEPTPADTVESDTPESNLNNVSTYDYEEGTDLTSSDETICSKFDILCDESINDLYDIVVHQASTQLNVKTCKDEIIDSLRKENSFAPGELENPTHENVEVILQAISSILKTRVVLLNITENSYVKVEASCPKNEAPIFICMIKEGTLTNFALPVFKKESQEKFSSIPITHPGGLTFDNLGRLHLSTPYSGPARVFVRSSKYDGTTVVSHISDIHKIISSDKGLKEKPVLMLMADGGPDFTPMSVLNTFYFYRLFKALELDILTVFTYAARYSAFNCIEHLWSPLSKKLAGVQYSAIVEDQRKPPCYKAGLSAADVFN